MATTNAIDTINCIAAMHLQEQKTPRCINYFQRTTVVDESCRAAMFNWLCQISDALSLNRETVGLAMSLLDRYLSSCARSSDQILSDRSRFQLASITAYYIAVKINEPVELGLSMLVKLCRGCYESSAIVSMEQDILSALAWRISTPTPLDFMRYILAMIPSTEQSIVESAEQHLVNATKDSYFSTISPSIVGAACVSMAFKESSFVCISSEQAVFWNVVCNALELDTSKDFVDVQQQLGKVSSNPKHFANFGQSTSTLTKGSCANLRESCSSVSVNVSVASHGIML
ncbi:hypothetical protein ACHAWO_000725 [Cyclotella atomus]|uniref:Cyclin-like domain-containing protein n=1 Tax=Cyclotella atomus TaxID=382360 RepID=A0ABD3PH62_9STRA